MSVLEDAVGYFVNQFGGLGILPIPPRSDTLGGFDPNLSGIISRDSDGLIMQGPKEAADGGDSSHKTGFAAFCSSQEDFPHLFKFESNGIMVRHPTQFPWNNWKNSTRDQLLAYVAGCWRAGHSDVNQRLLAAHAARLPSFTCQNTEKDEPGSVKIPPIGDPLWPDDIMTLKIASGDSGAYSEPLGQLWLQLSIEGADPDITVEKNQLIVKSIICGKLDLYVQCHPNYAENIRDYWSGWRNQPQIADALISVIGRELERYKGRLPIPLLAKNLLAVLRKLSAEDVAALILGFNPARSLQLQAKFAEAALRDAANHFLYVLNLNRDAAVAALRELGAGVNEVAKALAGAGQNKGDVTAGLALFGLPGAAVAGIVDAVFADTEEKKKPPTPRGTGRFTATLLLAAGVGSEDIGIR